MRLMSPLDARYSWYWHRYTRRCSQMGYFTLLEGIVPFIVPWFNIVYLMVTCLVIHRFILGAVGSLMRDWRWCREQGLMGWNGNISREGVGLLLGRYSVQHANLRCVFTSCTANPLSETQNQSIWSSYSHTCGACCALPFVKIRGSMLSKTFFHVCPCLDVMSVLCVYVRRVWCQTVGPISFKFGMKIERRVPMCIWVGIPPNTSDWRVPRKI